MEPWRSDWDEITKAINGNTINAELLGTLNTSNRGRKSPTKFVVSEQEMYLTSGSSGSGGGGGTPRALDVGPPQPEPEPEPEPMALGLAEGVPPAREPLASPSSAADAPPASVSEQRLLSLARDEGRPTSVAPMPTHDSAEQDLLRRTGLAPPAEAAGVPAAHSAGRELGISGDVVTVAFRKVYDPLAMPGIARPTPQVSKQLAALLEKSSSQPASPLSRRREAWASRGWAQDSVVANGALSAILGPSPLVATSSYQSTADAEAGDRRGDISQPSTAYGQPAAATADRGQSGPQPWKAPSQSPAAVPSAASDAGLDDGARLKNPPLCHR